ARGIGRQASRRAKRSRAGRGRAGLARRGAALGKGARRCALSASLRRADTVERALGEGDAAGPGRAPSPAGARVTMMLHDLALPLLRQLPPETAHRLTIRALRGGWLLPRRPRADPPSLAIALWGRRFPNPVGLAAGFDKNAEVPDPMLRFGFGFVECGTLTPRPQAGNPRPRLFRLEEDEALINRLGFNNEGVAAGAGRLELQRKSTVTLLIERLMAARAAVTPERPPPLLLKIAPDLAPEDRIDLADAALSTGIDGLVIANTTVARPP